MDAKGQEYWHEGGGQEDQETAVVGQGQGAEGTPRPETDGPGKEHGEAGEAQDRPAEEASGLGGSSARMHKKEADGNPLSTRQSKGRHPSKDQKEWQSVRSYNESAGDQS